VDRVLHLPVARGWTEVTRADQAWMTAPVRRVDEGVLPTAGSVPPGCVVVAARSTLSNAGLSIALATFLLCCV